MLSRIAESFFWIGRYLERADDTARILDVHLSTLVEDPSVEESAACQTILQVMGVEFDEEPARYDNALVLRLLGHDANSSSSMLAALAGARESARRARETVSADVWEAINTTWHSVSGGQLQMMRPHLASRLVCERVAMISGMADGTMSHDESWQFLVLGRNIERVDMTARLLSNATLSAGASTAWATTLRACGAHEAFMRTYRGKLAQREAAEFLLLDRLFPRSIIHALVSAEQCLQSLDPSSGRGGPHGESGQLLGRARAELEYRPLSHILADLAGEMERIQVRSSRASAAIAARYFPTPLALSWQAGVS
ncbi:MAG: alpha-E domain-containing protein [Lapillicoccus sp.]